MGSIKFSETIEVTDLKAYKGSTYPGFSGTVTVSGVAKYEVEPPSNTYDSDWDYAGYEEIIDLSFSIDKAVEIDELSNQMEIGTLAFNAYQREVIHLMVYNHMRKHLVKLGIFQQ